MLGISDADLGSREGGREGRFACAWGAGGAGGRGEVCGGQGRWEGGQRGGLHVPGGIGVGMVDLQQPLGLPLCKHLKSKSRNHFEIQFQDSLYCKLQGNATGISGGGWRTVWGGDIPDVDAADVCEGRGGAAV